MLKILITEVRCFEAVLATTAATDREVQGVFSRFFYQGDPKIARGTPRVAQQLLQEQLICCGYCQGNRGRFIWAETWK